MTELFVVKRARWLDCVSEEGQSGTEQYGIFAKQDLTVSDVEAENIVLEYRGACRVSNDTYPTTGRYVIGWKIGKQYRCINGERIAQMREPTLALVNHARRHANVRFVYHNKRVYGMLVADVSKGSELLADYGSNYTRWIGAEKTCRVYPVLKSI
jgi:hypothetical protein